MRIGVRVGLTCVDRAVRAVGLLAACGAAHRLTYIALCLRPSLCPPCSFLIYLAHAHLQPLQLHDTSDLFPGIEARGMGRPAAIPKKVADLTR